MYPFLRMALMLATTRRDPAMRPETPCALRLTVMPWDVDMFAELNNGRHLTLYDLGRFHYAQKLGFLSLLRRKKWGLVVGGSTIQYRKRLYPFQRFTLHTRCVGRDEKWFYFEQTAARGETAHSSAIVRTAVIPGPRGTVPTDAVAEAMGAEDWRTPPPDWVRAWSEAEAARPWPPALPQTARREARP